MSLIKCPECGMEISDLAEKCPNCGFPIGFQSTFSQQPQINTYQNGTHYSQKSQPVQVHAISCKKDGNSWLGIASLVLSILGCTFILGIIFAIIDLCRKDNRKKTFSIIALCICGFWLLVFIVSASKKEEPQTNISESHETYSTIQEDTTTEKEIKPEKNELKNNEAVNSSSSESKEDFIASCEEIPYKTLARNPENYIGKRIKLTVKVSQIIQGGLFDDGEYYRVYTNDTYDMWLGDEYFMYDCRIDDNTKILQDDILTVYGECDGTTTVERAFTGTKEDIVSIKAIYIDLIEEDNIGSTVLDGEDDSKYDGLTTGQKNALNQAKSYLEWSTFSYDGLVGQLEYEQYSHEDAVFAADNCGADWNEQAVKSAKNYMEFSSFSKDGLIEQLEYEGFTHEQAVYGAEQNGY